MAINIYRIKRWIKMLLGLSIYHVKQSEGRCYSFSEVKGYYNDLTKKVTKDKKNYYTTTIVSVKDSKGINFVFPVAIFQYGLGSFDLYLQNANPVLMKEKFLSCLEWAYKNQQEDGSWKNFEHIFPDSPYSAMAQGEGCSLLMRGYKLTGDLKYLISAKKALDFMLKPLDEGGTAEYTKQGIILYEYTHFPFVFNGWIFGIFGLLDYYIETKDAIIGDALSKTLFALSDKRDVIDTGYWSRYRNDNTISSLFYHNLHIAQFSVLYKYSGNADFFVIYKKFKKYKHNPFLRLRAFFTKAFQKLKEKNVYE